MALILIILYSVLPTDVQAVTTGWANSQGAGVDDLLEGVCPPTGGRIELVWLWSQERSERLPSQGPYSV